MIDRLNADEKENPLRCRKFVAAIATPGFTPIISTMICDDQFSTRENIGHYGSTFGVGRKDENDGKTRSNAAAALGNLARNGDALIADLLANDVPKALILLAKEYASEKSSSKRVAV